MIRSKSLVAKSAALLVCGSLPAAAVASDGAIRNAAALNAAGIAVGVASCAPVAAQNPLLIRSTCAMGDEVSKLQGAEDGGSGGFGAIGVAVGAALAVGAGIYLLVDDDDSGDGSAPTPTPTPTPTPVSS